MRQSLKRLVSVIHKMIPSSNAMSRNTQREQASAKKILCTYWLRVGIMQVTMHYLEQVTAAIL